MLEFADVEFTGCWTLLPAGLPIHGSFVMSGRKRKLLAVGQRYGQIIPLRNATKASHLYCDVEHVLAERSYSLESLCLSSVDVPECAILWSLLTVLGRTLKLHSGQSLDFSQS
jgi:hypothetical protein